MKKSLILTIIFFLLGCETERKEDGSFENDLDMIEFLSENLEDFNTLIDNREVCDEGRYWVDKKDEVPDFCLELKNKLNVIHVDNTIDSYNDPPEVQDETLLITYLKIDSVSNEFYKGYFYSLDSFEDDWTLELENLNESPNFNICETDNRLNKITDNNINEGWYLFTIRYCS